MAELSIRATERSPVPNDGLHLGMMTLRGAAGGATSSGLFFFSRASDG
jgi:hypothetical protein